MSMQILTSGCYLFAREACTSIASFRKKEDSVKPMLDPLREAIQELATKMGVRQSITVRCSKSKSEPCTRRVGIFFRSYEILLPMELFLKKPDRPNDQMLAIVARELAHIKNRDPLKRDVLHYCAHFVSVVVLSILFPGMGLLLNCVFSWMTANYVRERCFSVSLEAKADDVALKYLTLDQQLALHKYFLENRDEGCWFLKKYPSNLSRTLKMMKNVGEGEVNRGKSWLPWRWGATA